MTISLAPDINITRTCLLFCKFVKILFSISELILFDIRTLIVFGFFLFFFFKIVNNIVHPKKCYALFCCREKSSVLHSAFAIIFSPFLIGFVHSVQEFVKKFKTKKLFMQWQKICTARIKNIQLNPYGALHKRQNVTCKVFHFAVLFSFCLLSLG